LDSGCLHLSARCGEEGTRTPDLLLAKQALYQLSYFPQPQRAGDSRVRVLGFEPRTSALSELRSSQLSYTRNSKPALRPCSRTPRRRPHQMRRPNHSGLASSDFTRLPGRVGKAIRSSAESSSPAWEPGSGSCTPQGVVLHLVILKNTCLVSRERPPRKGSLLPAAASGALFLKHFRRLRRFRKKFPYSRGTLR
jgi:hypothetical protein